MAGAADTTISFTLNGRKTEVDAPDTEALLWVLRNRLGVKSPRFGCGTGSCGACTVLVDGRPETSCQLQVGAVAGAKVETAETILEADPPHPLVEAFAAERAAQCGYCLSGILMRAAALLRETPAPDRAAIVAALDDSLCRCGAHNRMLSAVARAAGEAAR